ncbi:hypothetical protein GFS03_11880 [Sulfolobus sp. E5-1-F]|uniref:hypothetical protein n=1 Tax=Sulfolobaceae TaxID=118883 RepID=UPI0012969CD1|nr:MULTISPECIES: hypothetical protein [unclassified Sulfolobus]QGA55225.1 hypothetical protein GFS03_11880 [Sulfolobus sp. E5-1-F]QGA68016.1 hypothetical protein GFS33_03690 [Sulfolobus sp. E11-6]
MGSKFIMYIILFLFLISLGITPIEHSNIQKEELIIQQYSTYLIRNAEYVNYTVVSGVEDAMIYSNISQVVINYNRTTYLLKPQSLVYYNNSIINVTIDGEKLKIYSGIPQLTKVILYTSGLKEVIWAGYISEPALISAYAYINGSGTLELQYLNGSSIYTLNVSIGNDQKISIPLIRLNYTIFTLQSYLNTTISTELPIPYRTFENISDFYVSMSSFFNDTLLPSMIWKSSNITAVEFFGTYGTIVAFIEVNNSSLLILKNLNADYYTPKYVITTSINNSTIILGIGNNSVESTANITFSYFVNINKQMGLLFSIENTSRLFLAFNNGSVYNIQISYPKNISVSNITIQDTVFLAEKIIVHLNSSISLIPITPKYNGTFLILKELPNGSILFINETDFFTHNGILYLVAFEPGETYYIVYSNHPLLTITQTKQPPIPYGANSLVLISGIVVILLAIASIVAIRKRRS